MSSQPPPIPSLSSPKTSGLAITSLVLGIVSITCLGFLTAIPALICGIVALNKVNKSPGTVGGHGLAIGGICTAGVGFFVGTGMLAAMLLPALNAAREKARRANCMANMRQLAQASAMYSAEHDGKCPRRLDDLRPYVSSTRIFHCPSATDESKSSYEILCPQQPMKPDQVVIRENPANHRGRGGNVLYNDGHAEWVPAQPRSPAY